MILYHGSNQLITKIDLSKSKDFKDFGRGFYLTKDYARAVAMAQRTTAIIGEGSPEVSPFIFNPSRCPIDVRIKKFDGRTAEWALYSRKDVFGLDLYEAGLGDRIEGFVRELFAGKGAVRKTLHKYVVRR